MYKISILIFLCLLTFTACGEGSSSSSNSPSVASSMPLNNDVNINVSDNLTITFNKSMDTTSINNNSLVLKKVSDNSTISTIVTYDEATKTAIINPDNNLSNDSFYKIEVLTNIKDASSNNLSSSKTIAFMVGDKITHNGYSYKVLKSPITGRNWLDRNLGAYEVCSKSRDNTSSPFASDSAYVIAQQNCFGDLYQWGRKTDGHEQSVINNTNTPKKVVSNTTSTRASSYTNVGHSNFITNSVLSSDWLQNATQDSNNIDDSGILRLVSQWKNIKGLGVCPVGFIVPSMTEIGDETFNYSGTNNFTTGAIKVINRDTAFKNFLRLPSSGYRSGNSGNILNSGLTGYLSSSSITLGSDKSKNFVFTDSLARETSFFGRAFAYPVRCIKK